ncbi:MAG: transposase [Methanobacteriaceae archaeon]|nr:transposase [Methanobacteriaceae archaeon]
MIKYIEEKNPSSLRQTQPHLPKSVQKCGTVNKSNKKSQALFRCLSCGYQDNFDRVASFNLQELALEGWAARKSAKCKD